MTYKLMACDNAFRPHSRIICKPFRRVSVIVGFDKVNSSEGPCPPEKRYQGNVLSPNKISLASFGWNGFASGVRMA